MSSICDSCVKSWCYRTSRPVNSVFSSSYHLSLSIHHKSSVWHSLFTGTPEQLNQGHCELYWWHWRSRHTSLPSLPCISAAVVHHPSPQHPGDHWRVMRAAHQRPRYLALHSSTNGLWSWICNKALVLWPCRMSVRTSNGA